MEVTSRPAWGCLDAMEIRDAAAGRDTDPAIREHLGRCGQCRQAVRELQGDLRRSTRTGGSSYRRPLLARPAFWLLLLALGLLAGALWLLYPRKAPPPIAAPTAAPPPAARPAPRPARRPRARRSGGSPGDADIVAVIRRNQTGVRMCYERALKRDPRLSVRLDVRVNVSAAGVVERVSLDGLPDGVPLSNCIRNVIKTWQFPGAPAAYDTAFPLRLEKSVSL
jgi:hypothetical protein